MNAASLIRLLGNQLRPLIESSYGELRSNLGTSHYHRLSNEELFKRAQAVFQNLSAWLAAPDPAAVHRYGEDLGKRRFAEGIPLGQVVLALILQEKHFWEFVRSQLQEAPDEKLRLLVAEFFARTIYSTALGFSEALAESQRKQAPRPAPPTPPPARTAPAVQNDLPVSRSGEIGEQGG
ncbi:MAG TPA: hypothetical protein VNN17_07795 [Terriglobia bacterium]|nr:hypothetical protein [Terriglobia bacterium]